MSLPIILICPLFNHLCNHIIDLSDGQPFEYRFALLPWIQPQNLLFHLLDPLCAQPHQPLIVPEDGFEQPSVNAVLVPGVSLLRDKSHHALRLWQLHRVNLTHTSLRGLALQDLGHIVRQVDSARVVKERGQVFAVRIGAVGTQRFVEEPVLVGLEVHEKGDLL